MSVIIKVPTVPVPPPTVEVELTHAVVISHSGEFLGAFEKEDYAHDFISLRAQAYKTPLTNYRVVDL